MDVLATVVSTKHNYCRYSVLTALNRHTQCVLTHQCALTHRTGVLPHSALPHIWRPPAFPRELHGFLLSLLERFEITFPVQSYAHKLGTVLDPPLLTHTRTHSHAMAGVGTPRC
jgi:hypothetical protein